jgi:hypothetical protein
MPWPTAPDYVTAITNWRVCLKDPELKTGTVVRNSWGTLLSSKGQFAIVFCIESGGRRWAVRCFIKEPVKDQQQRYEVISQYLESLRPPAFVGFEYQEGAVLSDGAWFPLVKMEWVEGQTLREYVREHVNDIPALERLAARWRGLVGSLEGLKIAHGDLQHGNVMVSGGELRLVDYDGMYVPTLAGQQATEQGHPNYQHPERTSGGFFDPTLDRFSAIVIWVSLKALARDASLWKKYNYDDNLIFTEKDFANPGTSPLFQELKGSPDGEVRERAERLAILCGKPIQQIPSLEEFIEPPVKVWICRKSNKRKGSYCTEVEERTYPAGSQPPQVCDVCKQTVQVWICRRSSQRKGPFCTEVEERAYLAGSEPQEACDVCQRETVKVWICRQSGKRWRPGCFDTEQREFTKGVEPTAVCDVCKRPPSTLTFVVVLVLLTLLLAVLAWVTVRQASGTPHRDGQQSGVWTGRSLAIASSDDRTKPPSGKHTKEVSLSAESTGRPYPVAEGGDPGKHILSFAEPNVWVRPDGFTPLHLNTRR